MYTDFALNIRTIYELIYIVTLFSNMFPLGECCYIACTAIYPSERSKTAEYYRMSMYLIAMFINLWPMNPLRKIIINIIIIIIIIYTSSFIHFAYGCIWMHMDDYYYRLLNIPSIQMVLIYQVIFQAHLQLDCWSLQMAMERDRHIVDGCYGLNMFE